MDLLDILKADLKLAQAEVAKLEARLEYARHEVERAQATLDKYVLAGDGTDPPRPHGLADFPSNPDAPDALRGQHYEGTVVDDTPAPGVVEYVALANAADRAVRELHFPRPASLDPCPSCEGEDGHRCSRCTR